MTRLSQSHLPARPLWQGQAPCLANLPDTCGLLRKRLRQAAVPARPYRLHGKLPRAAIPRRPVSRRRHAAQSRRMEASPKTSAPGAWTCPTWTPRRHGPSTSGSSPSRHPSSRTATRNASPALRQRCSQRASRHPLERTRGREGRGAAVARAACLGEQLSALVGALDSEGTTLSADVVANASAAARTTQNTCSACLLTPRMTRASTGSRSCPRTT